MKKLFKNRKLVIALVLALIMTMSMAVTVFAEATGGEGSEPKSYWDDPLFFEFVFLVVAFLSLPSLFSRRLETEIRFTNMRNARARSSFTRILTMLSGMLPTRFT